VKAYWPLSSVVAVAPDTPEKECAEPCRPDHDQGGDQERAPIERAVGNQGEPDRPDERRASDQVEVALGLPEHGRDEGDPLRREGAGHAKAENRDSGQRNALDAAG
jgi:hypothetical protein